jgi:hypothetical protein
LVYSITDLAGQLAIVFNKVMQVLKGFQKMIFFASISAVPVHISLALKDLFNPCQYMAELMAVLG